MSCRKKRSKNQSSAFWRSVTLAFNLFLKLKFIHWLLLSWETFTPVCVFFLRVFVFKSGTPNLKIKVTERQKSQENDAACVLIYCLRLRRSASAQTAAYYVGTSSSDSSSEETDEHEDGRARPVMRLVRTAAQQNAYMFETRLCYILTDWHPSPIDTVWFDIPVNPTYDQHLRHTVYTQPLIL